MFPMLNNELIISIVIISVVIIAVLMLSAILCHDKEDTIIEKKLKKGITITWQEWVKLYFFINPYGDPENSDKRLQLQMEMMKRNYNRYLEAQKKVRNVCCDDNNNLEENRIYIRCKMCGKIEFK